MNAVRVYTITVDDQGWMELHANGELVLATGDLDVVLAYVSVSEGGSLIPGVMNVDRPEKDMP